MCVVASLCLILPALFHSRCLRSGLQIGFATKQMKTDFVVNLKINWYSFSFILCDLHIIRATELIAENQHYNKAILCAGSSFIVVLLIMGRRKKCDGPPSFILAIDCLLGFVIGCNQSGDYQRVRKTFVFFNNETLFVHTWECLVGTLKCQTDRCAEKQTQRTNRLNEVLMLKTNGSLWMNLESVSLPLTLSLPLFRTEQLQYYCSALLCSGIVSISASLGCISIWALLLLSKVLRCGSLRLSYIIITIACWFSNSYIPCSRFLELQFQLK